ncbi:ATP-binding cassette domain-containing protein [Psychrobacter vallis]|uniref:ATP-binding cassette domain-containing protein n=1 Tax=Psychrobacter vallis TaxID=248451 RepID=UPI00387A0A19
MTGASGSGKSLLLRVLAGLLPMSSGDVCLQRAGEPNSHTSHGTYHSIHHTAPIQWRTHTMAHPSRSTRAASTIARRQCARQFTNAISFASASAAPF